MVPPKPKQMHQVTTLTLDMILDPVLREMKVRESKFLDETLEHHHTLQKSTMSVTNTKTAESHRPVVTNREQESGQVDVDPVESGDTHPDEFMIQRKVIEESLTHPYSNLVIPLQDQNMFNQNFCPTSNEESYANQAATLRVSEGLTENRPKMQIQVKPRQKGKSIDCSNIPRHLVGPSLAPAWKVNKADFEYGSYTLNQYTTATNEMIHPEDYGRVFQMKQGADSKVR